MPPFSVTFPLQPSVHPAFLPGPPGSAPSPLSSAETSGSAFPSPSLILSASGSGVRPFLSSDGAALLAPACACCWGMQYLSSPPCPRRGLHRSWPPPPPPEALSSDGRRTEDERRDRRGRTRGKGRLMLLLNAAHSSGVATRATRQARRQEGEDFRMALQIFASVLRKRRGRRFWSSSGVSPRAVVRFLNKGVYYLVNKDPYHPHPR